MGKVFGVNGSLAGLILRRTVPGEEQTSRSRPRGGEQKARLLWLETSVQGRAWRRASATSVKAGQY